MTSKECCPQGRTLLKEDRKSSQCDGYIEWKTCAMVVLRAAILDPNIKYMVGFDDILVTLTNDVRLQKSATFLEGR